MQKTIRMLVMMAVVALVGVILATPSWAANRDKSWELGLFVPFMVFDDPEFDGTEVDVDDAIGYGGRGGYNITKNHEVEFTVMMVPTEFEADVPGFGTVDGDIDATVWQIGYTYNFNGEKFIPYLGAGLGNFTIELDDPDEEADESVYYFTGGLRWFFTENVGLRMEAGYEAMDADPDTLNHTYAGVGLTWVIGG